MSEHLPKAEIMAVGLVTPVGLSGSASSAAVRAGRSRARKSPVFGKAWERHAMHLVEGDYLEPLNSALQRDGMSAAHGRMLRLGGPALAEAAAVSPAPAPVLLALPEVHPGSPDPVGAGFLQHLSVQAGVPIVERQSAIYRQGGAGALYALRDALVLLGSREASHVIVGGIDSFLDLMRLGILDSEDRIYGRRTRLGFMPGEGAGFLLLRSGQPRRPPSAPPLARVMGVGVGLEKGHRYSSEPYRGDGLADAFEALFQEVATDYPKVRCVYAGFNGEELPAKEWGVAQLRSSERFASDAKFETPADCIGDAGAALGAIMVGLAAMAINKGHLPEPRPIWATEDPGPCLVWSTSDREPRAATLLQW